MDFSLTADQKTLRAAMVRFSQQELSAGTDPDGPFDKARWRRCAEHGVLGLMTDPKYKSNDHAPVDSLTALIAMEGLGYGCPDNDLPFAINANIWTIQLAIAEHGNEEQKAQFIPRLANGEWIGAHAMTEPEAGSDAYSMQTTAIACDGGYQINGSNA